jgi:hypothetical protein
MTNADEGNLRPPDMEEVELAEISWSDLTDSVKQHLVQSFLSPKFESLAELCRTYNVSYHSVYRAFERSGVLRQRREMEAREEFEELIEKERGVRSVVEKTIRQVASKAAILDIADAQVMRELQLHEIPLNDLLNIVRRYSTDLIRVSAAIQSLSAAGAMLGTQITGITQTDSVSTRRAIAVEDQQVIRAVGMQLSRQIMNPHSMDINDPARLNDSGANNE